MEILDAHSPDLHVGATALIGRWPLLVQFGVAIDDRLEEYECMVGPATDASPPPDVLVDPAATWVAVLAAIDAAVREVAAAAPDTATTFATLDTRFVNAE